VQSGELVETLTVEKVKFGKMAIETISSIDIKKLNLTKSFLMSCLPKGFKFYRKPYYHQLVSIIFGLQFDGTGFLHPMGVGKSLCAIELARAFGIKKNILVVTVNSALRNWKEEFDLSSNNKYKVVTLEGSLKERSRVLKENKYDVYIINYEGLFVASKQGDKKKRTVRSLTKKISKYLLPGIVRPWDALIVDESRLIKNATSMRTRACMYLSTYSGLRMILTGTPIIKSLGEILSQHYILDYGETFGDDTGKFISKYYDREEKVIWGRGTFWDLKIKPGSERKVNKLLYQKCIRHKKSECFDLPKTTYIKRYVNLYGDQFSFYQRLKQNKALDVRITRNNIFTIKNQLIKFMQITGGYLQTGKGNPVIAFKNNAKLEEMEDILGEVHGEKVVIVASFVPEQKGIIDFLKNKKIKYVKIIGGTKPKDAKLAEDTFNYNKNINRIVISPRVGGRSINLTVANYIIFYSQDYDTELNWQTEERVNRIPAEKMLKMYPYLKHRKNVTRIDIIARDTVDEKVIEKLNQDELLFKKSIEGLKLSSLI